MLPIVTAALSLVLGFGWLATGVLVVTPLYISELMWGSIAVEMTVDGVSISTVVFGRLMVVSSVMLAADREGLGVI